MSENLYSGTLLIDDWRGGCAIYPSQRETIPAEIVTGVSWAQFVERLAPESGPRLATDKTQIEYFTLGPLRESLYVGKTAERMAQVGQTTGVQRSTQHVTASDAVCFDFDGIAKEQAERIGKRLTANNVAFLLYTTHSHGRPDKPGFRVRLLFPVDESLDRTEYAEFHTAVNDQLFDGLADRTGKSLAQQQSLWAAHPARAHLAKCVRRAGGVFGVSKFRERFTRMETAPTTNSQQTERWSFDLPKAGRYEQALIFLKAETYESWARGIIAFKSLAPHLGEDKARAMAISYAATSPEDSTRAQRAEGDSRYNPGEFFDRASPSMTAEQASNVLLAQAYKSAVGIVDGLRGQPTCSDIGKRAAIYLAAHYPQVWARMNKEAA